MQNLYYICAQPATFYYAWQVDAMLLSFEENGEVDLKKVHIVCSSHQGVDDNFVKVEEKWRQKGVLFAYYKDTRTTKNYISSIRPHILMKHWQKHPWLAAQNVFYHDCDIALTRPINFDDKLTHDLAKTCYLSDTVSYIGANYIDGKKHDLLDLMCEVVGDITPEEVRKRELESGGAQYLLKPGISGQFWRKVYEDSENLMSIVSKRIAEIKKDEPEWHELQIWCADMWAVLWNLWKAGYETPTTKDLEFTWGTQTTKDWETWAIYHNAGVTKEEIGKPFYKSKYISVNPTLAPRPGNEFASQKYYDLVVKAWNTTHGNKCILVGNGTSVMDNEFGFEIDKFDEVVRFNAARIDGYEKHVGSKYGTLVSVNRAQLPGHAKKWAKVYTHSWRPEDKCLLHKDWKEYRDDVQRIEESLWKKLQSDFGKSGIPIKQISTGLLTIFHMLKQYESVWLYGFDWWDREEHHYSDKDSRGTAHEPKKEFKIITQLAAEGKIKWLK